MSKKIYITIPNKVKPDLVYLFHKYLSRKSKEFGKDMSNSESYAFDDYNDMAAYWDEVFPGWDDDLDNDGDVLFPLVTKSKKVKKDKSKNSAYDSFWEKEKWHKNKHKHNKKKCNIVDINVPYSGDESNPSEYDYDYTNEDYECNIKEIWFYPDYHCKDDKLEFNSLKEFNDYCESMGYFVDNDVIDEIYWRYESHCCLNPKSEKIGLLEIMAEHSYGDMFYEACDESELYML